MAEPETEKETLPETEAPRPSNTLHYVGFVISGIWIAGLLVYIALKYQAFAGLEPNELGDFAAGAFAPLAFLWLVLGFFQQGEELRYSGRALWLQGEELKNSVEQQRELVNVTREQLKFDSAVLASQREELEKNSQPIFEITGNGSTPGDNNLNRAYSFRVTNHGRACTDFRVFGGETALLSRPLLQTGDFARFAILLPIASAEQVDIRMTYRDGQLSPKELLYRIVKDGQDFTYLAL